MPALIPGGAQAVARRAKPVWICGKPDPSGGTMIGREQPKVNTVVEKRTVEKPSTIADSSRDRAWQGRRD